MSQSNSRKRPSPTDRKQDNSKNDGKKSKKGESCVCPICLDTIVEGAKNKSGDDSIFCEGTCNSWIHRRCAGLSKPVFEILTKSDESFYCPHCRVSSLQVELNSLKQTVDLLTSDIATLKAQIPVTISNNNLSNEPTANQSQKSTVGKSKASTSLIPTSKISNNMSVFNADRKLNLVLYGLKENPEKTPKLERLQKDLDNVLSVFASINVKVEANSIKDCYRLGKFNPTRSKPRPIMVKFLRSLDTSSILANKKLLASPIYIKPDMTPEEKAIESILLKERKALIEQGHERRSIRMYKNSLYLNNQLFGQCNESGFYRADIQPPNQTVGSLSPTLHGQSTTSEVNPASMDTSKDQN